MCVSPPWFLLPFYYSPSRRWPTYIPRNIFLTGKHCEHSSPSFLLRPCSSRRPPHSQTRRKCWQEAGFIGLRLARTKQGLVWLVAMLQFPSPFFVPHHCNYSIVLPCNFVWETGVRKKPFSMMRWFFLFSPFYPSPLAVIEWKRLKGPLLLFSFFFFLLRLSLSRAFFLFSAFLPAAAERRSRSSSHFIE